MRPRQFKYLVRVIIFAAIGFMFIYWTAQPSKSQIQSSKSKLAGKQSAAGKIENSKVVAAFRHAWKGYRTFAWGFDELHPISQQGSNWFSLGLSIIDALDTAYIMKQEDIFQEAQEWIRTDLSFDQTGTSNVFEITIRVLGGLLSAFYFTKNQLFLDKAVDLADRLLVVFNTPSHIPQSSINLADKLGIPAFEGASTSEATTLQMEFKYLTYLTGNPAYWNAAQLTMKEIFKLEREDGLVPIYINEKTGKFNSHEIRLGSRGDSYYEYLIKQWLLTNQREQRYFDEYEKAVLGIRSRLIGMSAPSGLLFVGETSTSKTFSTKMDHLVCFLPGTMAWKATRGRSVTKETRSFLSAVDLRDLEFAEELMRSCVETYLQTVTGLSPEIVFWRDSGDKPENNKLLKYHKSAEVVVDDISVAERHAVPYDDETDLDTRFKDKFTESRIERDFEIHSRDGHNLLRPETVESLFILYRLTKKNQYRKWGWQIFQSFEQYTKVPEGGYSSLDDVRVDPPTKRDKMETFFLGETLKYFYLLFHDEEILPLDRFIFNTEAHPIPVFDSTQELWNNILLKI